MLPPIGRVQFAPQEGGSFFQPVLRLHEGDVLLDVGDVVVLQPDVEEELADEAVDAGFVRRVAADVYAALELAEDGKEPFAVLVIEVLAHDKHIEHVRPGAVHDEVIGRHVVGIELLHDLPRDREAFGMMGVQVMALVALDVVSPLVGHDDGCLGEELFPVGRGQHLLAFRPAVMDFLIREVAAVVHEACVVRLKILPRPIDGRELTVVRVLLADVVTRVIPRIAEVEILMQCLAHMYRKICIIVRHPIRLVSGNHDFYIHDFTSQASSFL